MAAATDVIESNLGKDLKKFLKKSLKDQDLQDKLAVADTKLGALIKEKLGLDIATGEVVGELFRGVRTQLDTLLTGMSESNLKAMQLGLSHSLSRYKLKFSADKVDTMIVQAIGLLDELDKEINTYAMRVREWYVRAACCLPLLLPLLLRAVWCSRGGCAFDHHNSHPGPAPIHPRTNDACMHFPAGTGGTSPSW